MRSLAIISLSLLLAAFSFTAHATGAHGGYGVSSHRHYIQLRHRQHYRHQHQSHRRHGHQHRRVVIADGHGRASIADQRLRLGHKPRHIARTEHRYGRHAPQPCRVWLHGGGALHHGGRVVRGGSFSSRFTLRF